MSITQRIVVTTAAWTAAVAVTLWVVLDPDSVRFSALVVIAVGVAMCASADLMLWKMKNDMLTELDLRREDTIRRFKPRGD